MRKLASIQTIAEIKPIEGADQIEAARINGWWVVVKKNDFKVNDLAVYLEVDSWVPNALAPFLSKNQPRIYNDIYGERLRTIKLRGQLSQGLLLPYAVVGKICNEGEDVTEILGIQKWEKPIPVQMQGQMRGDFPSFIRKTDQERIQNLPEVFDDMESEYEVSIKLDGSSMTVYWYEGNMGICSRNVDLKLDQEGNIFVTMAKQIFTEGQFGNLAIQGELMGPGVQGNRENLSKHEFFVFDIWDINNQEYLPPSDVRELCATYGLQHVPVMYPSRSLKELNLPNISAILGYAEGQSLNNFVREGLVFKRVDGKFSFKAISNKFLLKEE